MIASFFLIPLVVFGSVAVYYHLHTPVKMWVAVRLLGYDKTGPWAFIQIFHSREKAIPALVGGFGSKNDQVRSMSFFLLVDILPRLHRDFDVHQALPYVVRGLWSRNANKRAYSVQVLRFLGNPGLKDKRVLPRLIELLSDPAAEVRANVAQTLGSFREKAAIPELTRLLSDPDGEVRRNAADALGVLRAKEAVPELIKLLSDPQEWLGWRAAQALERITGESFGDIYAVDSDATRQEVIQKWLEWWEENKEKFEAGGTGEN